MDIRRSFVTVVAILALSRLLLPQGLPGQVVLPFNVARPGLDTGIAVSNTGFTSHSITFLLFADTTDGKSAVTLNTPDFPDVGEGLDEDGRLPGGATYTVLLSELCTFAGLQDYAGQIIIEARFPGQAVNFIFDSEFETTHGYTATVAPPAPGLFLTDSVLPVSVCEEPGFWRFDKSKKWEGTRASDHSEADTNCCEKFNLITIDECRDFCERQKKGTENCPRMGAAVSDVKCEVQSHHDHILNDLTYHVVSCGDTSQVCVCNP